MSMDESSIKSTKVWHFGFFAGVIGLNLLLFFRTLAMKSGGWFRAIWTLVVIATGALMLVCLYHIRKQRPVSQRRVQSEQPTLPPPPPSKYAQRRSTTPRRAKRKKKKK